MKNKLEKEIQNVDCMNLRYNLFKNIENKERKKMKKN